MLRSLTESLWMQVEASQVPLVEDVPCGEAASSSSSIRSQLRPGDRINSPEECRVR
jgi:hypothetical protein